MSLPRALTGKGNLGSFIVSFFFLIAGIVTLYDTASYADIDSKVFPRAVAIALIIFATITIVRGLLAPSNEGGFEEGTWWRRILLVVTMLATCMASPYVGFLPAGAIAFAGGLIAGMHDQWSRRTIVAYWGSGAVMMISFYVLFRYGLLVPLP